jgi:hypothetical protein
LRLHHPRESRTPAALGLAGKVVYDETCVACHGPDGTGVLPGVPDFTSKSGPLAKSDVRGGPRSVKAVGTRAGYRQIPIHSNLIIPLTCLLAHPVTKRHFSCLENQGLYR